MTDPAQLSVLMMFAGLFCGVIIGFGLGQIYQAFKQ